MQNTMKLHHYRYIPFSTFQENLSQILDEILKTDDSIEIEHQGQRFQVIPVNVETSAKVGNKLDNLIERPYLLCEPEEIVHLDWSKE